MERKKPVFARRPLQLSPRSPRPCAKTRTHCRHTFWANHITTSTCVEEENYPRQKVTMGPFFDNRAEIIWRVLAREGLLNIGIRPSANFYKTKTGCKSGDTCLFPHHKVDEQPHKRPKKGHFPGSGKHSVYTHFSKDPNCDICLKTQITRASCRGRAGTVVPRAENFGDLITDHKNSLWRKWIAWQSSICRGGTRLGNPVVTVLPVQNLMKFLEPTRKSKVIYTDNSLEFGKACEDLSWNHCTSTPHTSETNGIAERAVRRAKEGTSEVLLQSRLDEKWWTDSMECNTYLRHIQDLLSDGETPYERRFGEPFKGPIIPFVSLVEYHPISAKDQSRIHQFGKKVLPGLFFGYALYAGWIWNGDIMVADIEELETMDASEIYSERLNAKEVIFPKEMENSFGFSMFEVFRKTDEDFGGSISWNTQPNCRYFSTSPLHFCHHSF